MTENFFEEPVLLVHYGGFGVSKPNRYLDSNYYRRGRIHNFNNTSSKGNLFQFFIKPSLSIEYDSKLTGTCVNEGWAQFGRRKYLSVLVRNAGRGIAENCIGHLTLIPNNSNAKILPSPEDKSLTWDNGNTERTIGAKKGKAILNVVFSDEYFKNIQVAEKGGHISDDEKIYAKVSTPNSLNYNSQSAFIGFAEDGLRIGDTCFRLTVNTINGESTEAIVHVKVSDLWREISLEKL